MLDFSLKYPQKIVYPPLYSRSLPRVEHSQRADRKVLLLSLEVNTAGSVFFLSGNYPTQELRKQRVWNQMRNTSAVFEETLCDRVLGKSSNGVNIELLHDTLAVGGHGTLAYE
jgi:hypothetical protein